MRVVRLKCPHCGATFKVTGDSKKAVCEYCGAEVTVPRRKAKIIVKRSKVNKRAFVVFGAVAALLIIVTGIILNTVINGKRGDYMAFKTEGVYLVGKDLLAGEYVLYPNVKKSDGDVTPVLEVRKTKDAAVDKSDFLYRREFFMRQYVNLNEGEYIAFEYALLYKPENVKLKPLDEKGYFAAQLKVGTDIAAGEYVVVGENKQVQYFITSKPQAQLYGTAALNSPDMLSFDYCENRVYLKVKDGEYLSFVGGKLYKSGDAPAPLKNSDGAIMPGQYKVGTDIQSGKYLVSSAENKQSQAWVCLNKNSVGTDRVSSWESQIIAAGGETLLFLRLEDYEDGSAEIEIPESGDDELYITFWYCYASAQ